MPSITYLGHYSILEAFPVIGLAQGVIRASVGQVASDIASRLAGAIKLQAGVAIKPPSVAGSLVIAQQLLASLSVAIAPPSVNFAAAAAATLIARLQGIKAALDLALLWGNFPGSVHLFVYQGRAAEMGSTITGAITGGMLGGVMSTDFVVAPIVVVQTTDTVSAASLHAVMKF